MRYIRASKLDLASLMYFKTKLGIYVIFSFLESFCKLLTYVKKSPLQQCKLSWLHDAIHQRTKPPNLIEPSEVWDATARKTQS